MYSEGLSEAASLHPQGMSKVSVYTTLPRPHTMRIYCYYCIMQIIRYSFPGKTNMPYCSYFYLCRGQ